MTEPHKGRQPANQTVGQLVAVKISLRCRRFTSHAINLHLMPENLMTKTRMVAH